MVEVVKINKAEKCCYCKKEAFLMLLSNNGAIIFAFHICEECIKEIDI